MNKKILHRVFEHMASQFPNRTAVEEESGRISYKELNTGANGMARVFAEMGVTSETVVGLCLPAGINYIMAALAVQKAGGVFMPLDGDAPPMRLALMLDKTDPAMIITRPESKDGLISIKTKDQPDIFTVEQLLSMPAAAHEGSAAEFLQAGHEGSAAEVLQAGHEGSAAEVLQAGHEGSAAEALQAGHEGLATEVLQAGDNLEFTPDPHDPAYIIFT
ncbi:MAG: AMP-binding protein, partial [Desulfamplus sp.]|nr:AMP-binding protein [Desulfamplus sp.]